MPKIREKAFGSSRSRKAKARRNAKRASGSKEGRQRQSVICTPDDRGFPYLLKMFGGQ